MSDDIALAVGKIILAWGRLDQELHLLIRSLEHALGETHSQEGRFSERRKIFRRLCIRMVNDEKDYRRRFDRACLQLVRLERKRGKIAHGIMAPVHDGAMFFDVPEALTTLHDQLDQALIDSTFSAWELQRLQTEIGLAAAKNSSLALEAVEVWKRGTG
jgi:hypothetical protein